MKKYFIQANCKKQCKYNNSCCMLPTEVIINDDSRPIDLLVFGQGAGKDEERLKCPFVGRAGKYMRDIIMHIWTKYHHFNLAISNNVRFHPTDTKGKDCAPTQEEIKMCVEFLVADIEKLDPTIIMPLGKNAVDTFVESLIDIPMRDIRGTFLRKKIGSKIRTLVPTYHPSFLCRQYGTYKPEEKNVYDNYFFDDIIHCLNLQGIN